MLTYHAIRHMMPCRADICRAVARVGCQVLQAFSDPVSAADFCFFEIEWKLSYTCGASWKAKAPIAWPIGIARDGMSMAWSMWAMRCAPGGVSILRRGGARRGPAPGPSRGPSPEDPLRPSRVSSDTLFYMNSVLSPLTCLPDPRSALDRRAPAQRTDTAISRQPQAHSARGAECGKESILNICLAGMYMREAGSSQARLGRTETLNMRFQGIERPQS
jgi:hypothetical protein